MSTADLIAEARALFHREPSRRAWEDLCSLLDHTDLSTPESSDLLRYCEDHLSRWPDGLRAAPTRWGLRRLDGERVPQLALARSANVSFQGATGARVAAFCGAPESQNLSSLDALDAYTTHDAIAALTSSALATNLTRVGHCISTGNLLTHDCPLSDLVRVPPAAWSREGVLALNNLHVDVSTTLLGPGALAVRSVTSPAAGVTCRAIARRGAPLNLRALNVSGYDPFLEDDARLLSTRLLPRLRSLSLSLANGASVAQGDPLAVLDRAGVLAPLESLSLRGAHPRSADLIASCAPSRLDLTWPQARHAGKLLAGQGENLRALSLRFGSFRGGLAGSNLASLRALDVFEATLSIDDYQALAHAPLSHLTLHATHSGHQGHRLDALPPGLRAIVEAPMPALRVFEVHELGTDEVTPHDITHAPWFASLERLSISSVSPDPDQRLQRASIISALERARAPSLHTLNLSNNHLSSDDVCSLGHLAAPLRRLLLARNAIEDATSLSRCDLSRLRELDLADNPTRPDTLGDLLRSGALGTLEQLDADGIATRSGDLSTLFARTHLPRLHSLSLRRCAVSLADATALRDSVLSGLTALDLSHARFAEGALELLLSADECASLTILSLDDAQLTNIPPDHALSPRLHACLVEPR